jgi:multiple sugar transport system substrate-binding protein
MIRPRALQLITLALVLAGCGGKASNPGDKVHIKLVHFYTDKKDVWQKDVADAFMKTHPNIQVDVEAIPYGLYTTKILASAASGSQLGDVVVMDDWFGQELFKRNYTLPLDSLFNRDLHAEDFFTQFFTVWRKGNTQNAPLMGMPACGGVTVLFYNKDLFDKAKLQYPDSTWTYNDLLAAAQKLTTNDADPRTKTWGFISDDGISTGIDTWIYSNGGKIVSDDQKHSAVLDPQSVAAFQSYVDLTQKYHVMPMPDPSQTLGQRFLQGHVAMMLSFDVTKLEIANARIKWDLTAPPKGAAEMMDRESGQAFGITRTSPHPSEAWELIKFIATLPTKQGIDELFYTAMPLYKPLANSPEYLEGMPKCDRRAIVAINNGKVFTLITPGWQEWRDNGFSPNVQDMLAGRKTVSEGLHAIDQKINEVLARANAQ